MPAANHLDAADALLAAAIVIGCAVTSGLMTRVLIPVLRRRDVLDRPNQRSSHATPTPRGGGIAVIGTLLLAWIGVFSTGRLSSAILAVAGAAGLLAVVCWLDDLHGLSPLTRLMAQAATVAIGLLALPEADNPFAHWLGAAAYLPLLGLVWLWWINLFNFMDGIDGIATSEAAAIGGGLLLLTALGADLDPSAALLAAAVVGASLGFLVWNWSPARIFLGDVGSIPLGYLTGYLLIGLANAGRWRVALILPLYFLADATITLARRLARGEPVWQAHRQHFYQQGTQRGLSHAAVVRRVIAANLLLIGCAWAAENGAGLAPLAAAIVIVALLLAALARGC